MKLGPKPRDWRLRFWEKVNKRGPEECWEWTAGCDQDGYGLLKIGSRGVDRRNGKAPRLSYELAKGAIPSGSNVCHRCDNRKCVNPSHLFLGSVSDNIRDMDNKGRRVVTRGERHGRSKLSDKQVEAIRQALASGGRGTACALARTYGVSHQHVSKLKYGLKR